MNLSLSQRILAVVGVVLLFLIVVAGFNYNTISNTIAGQERVSNLNVKLLEDVLELEVAMLEGRRAEKDFLLRKDPKYISRHDGIVSKMRSRVENIARLEKELGNTGADRNQATLTASIDAYSKGFHNAADATLEKGEGDKGIIGKFRKDVHNLEELYKKAGELILTKEMLMLRRHEKDYLLRGTDKYVQKVEKRLALLDRLGRELLDKNSARDASSLLDNYESGFNAVVRIDSDIKGYIATLRDAVHKLEPLIAESKTTNIEDYERQVTAIHDSAANSQSLTLIVSLIKCLTLSILIE